MGNNFNTRIEGSRIRHVMGPASIKMYDKHVLADRIETTINDLSFLKHYRPVEHRDGSQSPKMAPMKKGIYSLGALSKLMRAANHRYLLFISDIDDPSAGLKTLSKISKSVTENNLLKKDSTCLTPMTLNCLRPLAVANSIPVVFKIKICDKNWLINQVRRFTGC